jgi:hypothetical protein
VEHKTKNKMENLAQKQAQTGLAELIKVETFLPLFGGFYNTIFEPNEENEIDYINSERESNGLESLDFDDFEFQYDAYKNDVAEGAVVYLAAELNRFGVESIEFQSISSPKHYNYANDSINVEMTINPVKIFEYIQANKREFDEYIKKNYSSRDGFMSYHSNDGDDWLNDTENLSNFNDGHKLGAVLDFVIKHHNANSDESDAISEINMYYSCEAYLSVNDSHFHCNKIK